MFVRLACWTQADGSNALSVVFFSSLYQFYLNHTVWRDFNGAISVYGEWDTGIGIITKSTTALHWKSYWKFPSLLPWSVPGWFFFFLTTFLFFLAFFLASLLIEFQPFYHFLFYLAALPPCFFFSREFQVFFGLLYYTTPKPPWLHLFNDNGNHHRLYCWLS